VRNDNRLTLSILRGSTACRTHRVCHSDGFRVSIWFRVGYSVSHRGPHLSHSPWCPLQATRKRSALLDFIAQEAGLATLLDVRRTEGYDAAKAVDKLLDAAVTRAWMRASTQVRRKEGKILKDSNK
jgi:hypothetical protein